jgi:DNA-binding response OmpR family regulator
MLGNGESPRVPVILLVDDDEYVRLTVRSVLRRSGSRIVEAATASEALELAVSEQPAIAIVDLGLPDLDGLYLVNELREKMAGATLRVIVLTGQHPGETEMHDAGVDALVLKPFRLAELRETVHAQLAAQAAVRAAG